MSIEPIVPTPEPAAADQTAGATQDQSSQSASQLKIATLEDLRVKAPQVYDAMMMGIALHIRNEQEASNRRIEDLQRQQRRG